MKNILLLLCCSVFLNIAFSQHQASKPMVIKPCYFDVSPPLRDMAKASSDKADNSWKDGIVKNKHYPRPLVENDYLETDPVVQDWFGSVTDTTIQNHDGVPANGYLPPDTDGEVGLNHYFQVVNVRYAIYNKSGLKLIGPTNNSSIFSGLPNNSNDGDAVVLYDEVADRWLFSQFSLPNYPNGPFYEMVAVSQTPDPTGAWYRYQYQFTDMPDYPKLSVWPDAYYMSTNRFGAVTFNYKGTGAVAMDRTKMLAGDPTASMIFFTLGASAEPYAVLPSDCDGTFPPMGTPNYFTYLNDGPDHLSIYEFHADFVTPSNSTYTPSLTLPVAAFTGGISGGIPQFNTTKKLDAISGRIMFRLPFRNFGTHWSMAACGTVNVGSGVAGVRWYELRKVGSSPWTIYQQGTYSPDSKSRWMGSIAMDNAGNMAIGYSVSSADMYPAIRYTGRLATDPLNVMTFQEGNIISGNGSQTDNSGRWGDYSAMTADPSSPATFWYTNQYYFSSAAASWKTRIGSFSFANVYNVEATATPDAICVGQTTQLNAAAVGGSGTYTYVWTSVPAGFSSTVANPVASPIITTKYVATVTDGIQTIVDTAMVTVAGEPVAFAGNDTTFCVTWNMWPILGEATFASSVKWTTAGDGAFIAGSDTSLYAIYAPGVAEKAAGAVDLTLTAQPIGTCLTQSVDAIHIILDPCTGIGDIKGSYGVTITPNPSNGMFTVIVSGVKGDNVNIAVSSMQGFNVIDQNITSATNTLTREIDLSKYSKGVYVVKISAGNNSTTEKIVIK